jgi:hypothetical protein
MAGLYKANQGGTTGVPLVLAGMRGFFIEKYTSMHQGACKNNEDEAALPRKQFYL